jgi:hypothetical protein
MDDVAVARAAVAQFGSASAEMLPQCSYLLPELSALQLPAGSPDAIPFADAVAAIDPGGGVRDAARVLGRCRRAGGASTPASLIESLRLFCEIEARIRFSLWPGGAGAPHHFSKLLGAKRVQAVFARREILAIFAICADPQGLNLRNVTAHGFSVDTSLTLALLNGIAGLLARLPAYAPPEFDFAREQELFNFHRFRLALPADLAGPGDARFARFDTLRAEALATAYSLFADGRTIDALLLLFPLFEHSLRRAAVAVMGLPPERLCASSEEHFLSILECCEALPPPLRAMVTDLLFAPDGPRLRDRLMHGNVRAVPRVFAFCLFALFEKCSSFFETGEPVGPWGFAFHPARNLEFELARTAPVKPLDLLAVYDSESYERLIECLAVVRAVGARFKDPAIAALLDGPFQRFIAVCVLYFAGATVKTSAVKHLLALAYAPSKFAPVNDADRFRMTVASRVKAIAGVLPFVGKGVDCSYEWVEAQCANTALLDDAVIFAEAQIAAKAAE